MCTLWRRNRSHEYTLPRSLSWLVHAVACIGRGAPRVVARKGRKRCKDDEADMIIVRRDRVAAGRMRLGACIVRALPRIWLCTGWQAGVLRRRTMGRMGRRRWPCHSKLVTQWTMCAAI